MNSAPHRSRLALDGTWQLAFDRKGHGVQEDWTRGNFPQAAESEVVPAIWEISHPDIQGIGFYRRTFGIPANWAGRIIYLNFGGASYRADVWLNGLYLGGHEGSYTPFAFEVSERVKFEQENELVVRVAGLSRSEAIDGRLIQHVPASKQSWYYIYSGLWGGVTLETRPHLALETVWVEPNLRQETVRIQPVIANYTDRTHAAQLCIEILDPDGRVEITQIHLVSLAPNCSRPEFRITLPHPRAWNCETPNLYTVCLTLEQDEQTLDTSTTRFGMRDFTIRDGEFFLNDEPILIRGVLLQPNYPKNLIVPPDDEMLRRDVALVKEAGFNLVRAHLRPSPAGFLDIADELGMLVYAESSIAWIRDNSRLPEHCAREMQAVVERDRNHPSVVIWGVHNENRVANAMTGEALVRLVRGLDPTRVVLDHSGGSLTIDQDFGWIDRTTAVANRETAREPMQDIHAYVGAPIPDGVYEWMRTLGITPPKVDMSAYNFGSRGLFEEWSRELRGYEGKIFVSELGCGGLADLEKIVAGYGTQTQLVDAREMIIFRDGLANGFRERHLERVFGSLENLVARAQARHAEGTVRQVEALLCNPRISGYSITQWNDVAWEFHAGLVDHWRNPKAAYYAVQRLHRPQVLVTKAASAVGTVGTTLAITLTLIQQLPAGNDASLTVNVAAPSGTITETKVWAAPAARGVNECGSVFVPLQETGAYVIVARLMRGGEVIAETTERILSLKEVSADQIEPLVEWVGERPNGFLGNGKLQEGERVLYAAQPATVTIEDWARLIGAVRNGKTAIIGALTPRDELALRVLAEQGIAIDLHFGIGNWMPCYHWVPNTQLFEGLPAGDLAGEPYVDVLPWYVPVELGDEIWAGSFRNTQSRLEGPRMLWYSDVEAVALGEGTLIFCQYRLTQNPAHPVAARLLWNLVNVARQIAPHS